jgi:hypothetical protein
MLCHPIAEWEGKSIQESETETEKGKEAELILLSGMYSHDNKPNIVILFMKSKSS